MSFINRQKYAEIVEMMDHFPVVAIIGPRQCGKSTIAKEILKEKKEHVYLDLDRLSDLQKLKEAEFFLEANRGKLVCIDEVQRFPELFSVLRAEIDEDRRNCRFLILGSASRDLLKQGSESLAGRICYIELSNFSLSEVNSKTDLNSLWVRGGFPDSLLSGNDEVSLVWRENFIRTYIERDIPQLGFSLDSVRLRKLLTLCAHQQGQLIDYTAFGKLLNQSGQSSRNHIELLEKTFVVRILKPFEGNLKKRLVKTPKVYIRDSGILHSLLEIEDINDLLGSYVMGPSWEGFAMEQILAEHPKLKPSFYRTSHGAEIDLLLQRKGKTIAVEFKASKAPVLSKGFYMSLETLNITDAWVIAPINDHYKIKENITVSGLKTFLEYLAENVK